MSLNDSRKILGIIGGMGPVATADFFKELVQRTKAEKDWDHLHVIIDNNVSIPSRTRAVLYDEISPVEAMQHSAKKLESAGCDFIAVPCNSAHFFYSEVMAGIRIPWINMLEVVSQQLQPFKTILILGAYVTVTRKLYDSFLESTCYLNEEDNKLVTTLIERVKTQQKYEELKDEILNRIHKKYGDIDCVLLACSELPMAFPEGIYGRLEIISANRLYIDRLIQIGQGNVEIS